LFKEIFLRSMTTCALGNRLSRHGLATALQFDQIKRSFQTAMQKNTFVKGTCKRNSGFISQQILIKSEINFTFMLLL
jgi:hypothetical protein